MSMGEPRTDLLDITDRSLERDPALSHGVLQVAAGQILEYKVMKDGSLQIAGRAVSDAADDIRVPNAVKGDRLILKILDQRAFEVGVEVILKKDVQGLDHNGAVRRLWRRERVPGDKYFSITAAAESVADIVSLVQPAVIKRKLSHRVASSDLGPTGPRNKYDITSRKFKKRIVDTTRDDVEVGFILFHSELPLALASGNFLLRNQ